jgi:carbon monoxide dehydrogenase subunit G
VLGSTPDTLLRDEARRSPAFMSWVPAIIVATALGLASAAAAQSPVTSIEVRQADDGYVADLVMRVAVPPEQAFAVLIDFENMASWVPNVRVSRVVKRDVNRATIEYEGVARYGFLSVPFTTVREIEFDAPAWLRSTQIKGTMKRHESRIDFTAEGNATRLDYHVEMAPRGIAALVLNQRRVEHELTQHFEAIGAEILRRKAATLPASP